MKQKTLFKRTVVGVTAGALCCIFAAASIAEDISPESLDNVTITSSLTRTDLYNQGTARFKADYPDTPIHVVDRSVFSDSDEFTKWVYNKIGYHWNPKLLKKKFDSKSGALLYYSVNRARNTIGCMVFPAGSEVTASEIVSAISDDRELIPLIAEENSEFLTHEVFYHELGHCLLLSTGIKPSGEYSREAIADAFAAAIHIADYGLGTGFPQRLASYRELVTLNRVKLSGEYGSFAAGLTYATQDSVRAIYNDAAQNPHLYKGQSIEAIYKRVIDVTEKHQWSQAKKIRFNALARTIEKKLIGYNKQNGTDYDKFGEMPYEKRAHILREILATAPHTSEFIDGYRDARNNLQSMPITGEIYLKRSF